MPELPEVETIRRGLQKRILGHKIQAVEIKFPKSFIGNKEDVLDQEIVDIVRRAKVLAIKLENGYNLLFHLKMTGQLIWRTPNEISNFQFPISNKNFNSKIQIPNSGAPGAFAGGHPDHNWHASLPNSTTAIVFTFDDGSALFFNDMRKFGWCKVLTNDELDKIFREEYGPEPIRLADARSHSSLSPRALPSESKTGQADSSNEFTVEYLMLRAKSIPNRNIKQFLTDQSIVAGIGNIYVDEALFLAKIMPTRKVKDIVLSEWKEIIKSVRHVLDEGIKYGGTTDSDYVNAEGKKGGMQDHLAVYHRTGEPCKGCNGVVQRMSIGGRGTHFCPQCQK